MAAAHDPRPRFVSALLVASGLLLAPLAACRAGDPVVSAPAGPERAAALVEAWAVEQGAPGRTLGADGDVAFGDSGLHYDASADMLYGRAWVNMARLRGAPAERIATYRRMEAALNDPRIGGMYERAGGYFVLDAERQGFFLVRRFPVAATSPDAFIQAMTRLQTVAAQWTTKWFLDVAMIMHGKERAPDHPVTLDDAQR